MTPDVENESHCKRGATLITHRLTYAIKEQKISKLILDNVDFITKPGQLMAIMGPSGAGKTTFLNALAGRLKSRQCQNLSGTIYCDGYTDKTYIKRISNYVMQQDHLLDFLTVGETLRYTARLRLRHLSREEQEARVNAVIQELGLKQCETVLIGGDMKKGLSGGQKKRCSIAIEMLDDPALLFLDEPTSGLDSSLAHDVLKVLVRLTKSGRTVICTVHQPRSQAFVLFDQLMLLSKGKCVYLGPASHAQGYFSTLGYHCPSSFNPADFFLDLISADNTLPTKEDQELNDFHRHQHQGTDNEAPPPVRSSSSSLVLGRVCIAAEEIDQLPDKFLTSSMGVAVHTQIQSEIMSTTMKKADSRKMQERNILLCSMHAWVCAFRTLTSRSFLNNRRNPMQTFVQLGINLLFGFLMGGIFFQMQKGGPTAETTRGHVQNIMGYIFFICAQFLFSNMDSLLAFPRERIMFNRDTANGLYVPSAFFMAKMTADLIFQHSPTIIFGVIAYFMGGLGNTAEQFFTFLVLSQVTVFAAASYCYMVGASVARFEIANIVAPVGGVVFMLLSGFYLKDDDVPKWIAWARFVVFLRFSFFSFVQNEYRPGEGTIGSGKGLLTNEYVLKSIAKIPDTPGMWTNCLIAFALGCVYRICAYFLLKYFNRGLGVEA